MPSQLDSRLTSSFQPCGSIADNPIACTARPTPSTESATTPKSKPSLSLEAIKPVNTSMIARQYKARGSKRTWEQRTMLSLCLMVRISFPSYLLDHTGRQSLWNVVERRIEKRTLETFRDCASRVPCKREISQQGHIYTRVAARFQVLTHSKQESYPQRGSGRSVWSRRSAMYGFISGDLRRHRSRVDPRVGREGKGAKDVGWFRGGYGPVSDVCPYVSHP